MLSHFRSPVDFRRVPREFHSVAKQASFETLFFRVPGRFWNDFARFWEAKMEVKIDFGEIFFGCFCQLRFGIVFESFFGGPNL